VCGLFIARPMNVMEFRCVCDPEVSTQVAAPSCGALWYYRGRSRFDTSPVTDCYDQIINEYMLVCGLAAYHLTVVSSLRAVTHGQFVSNFSPTNICCMVKDRHTGAGKLFIWVTRHFSMFL